MAEKDEIEKVKKQLEDLKKNLDEISKRAVDNLIKKFTEGKASLSEWKIQLENFQTRADSLSDSLDYVSKSLSSSVSELRKGNEEIRKQVSASRKLSSIADHLLSIRKGDISFDKKKIQNLKEEAKLRANQLKSLQSQYSEGSNMYAALQSDIEAAKELLDAFEGIEETNKKTTQALGGISSIASGLDKTFSKIFGSSLGIADAVDETKKLGQEAERIGNQGFKPMSTFVGILGSKLKETLTLTNLLQGSFGLILDSLTSIDTGAGNMAKEMNITYSEALGLRKELTDIANASKDTNVNTQMLEDTLVSVNQLMGARVSLNEADLTTMAKMNKLAGISNEENLELLKLSTLNNKSVEQTNVEILGAAKAYAGRNKLAINEKQILKDVSKASAALTLSLGGGADKIAESAVKARQFGLNLEQAEKISQSLLDFESSIENELSAELLTGKDLNFERARGLALNGDIAGATEEIAKQVGTAAQFGKMNVIQQEALAKAAGMNREELAKSLIDREALAKLGAKEGQSAQDRYNELKAQGMSEAEIAQKLGSDEQARMFEQQSIQEQFNQTVEKLKEIFVSVGNALMPVFDILSSIFDVIGPIAGVLGQIVGFVVDWGKYLLPIIAGYKVFQTTQAAILGLQVAFNSEKAIQTALEKESILNSQSFQVGEKVGLAIQQSKNFLESMYGKIRKSNLLIAAKEKAAAVASAIPNIIKGAWTSLGVIPVAGAALAAVAAAAGIAYLMSQSSKGNDVFSPAPGGSGYGKRTLLGPEGAIQLNNEDTVIAGTKLFGDSSTKKADDMMSSPKGTIQVANSTAPKKEAPVDPSAGTNARLDALIATTGKVNSISTLRIQ